MEFHSRQWLDTVSKYEILLRRDLCPAFPFHKLIFIRKQPGFEF